MKNLSKGQLSGISVFGKCLALIAAITAIVVAVISYTASTTLHNVVEDGLRRLAVVSTQGLAEDLGGAIQFDKPDAAKLSLDQLIARAGDSFALGLVFDATDQVLLKNGAENQDGKALLTLLAKTARQSGAMEIDQTGLNLAVPVRFGKNNDLVGVVAIAWSARSLHAANRFEQTRSLAIGLGVFAVLLVTGGVFLHWLLRAPLGQIGRAMQGVADARFTDPIPLTGRGDEIGLIARQLDVMRANLQEASEAALARAADQDEQRRVVAQVSQSLKTLAAGDLTGRLSDTFPAAYAQLRDDFNSATARLSVAFGEVATASRRISSEAIEINRFSANLSQRTENQAATLEETAAAMDQLTSRVRAAAAGAQEVEAVVQTTQREARQSGTIVNNAVTAMNEIKTFSGKISTIISVIDDIAFQTNLLALNAGVEAARAGDAGRGFAVVASEVRALAKRSSDAAREIKMLITDSAQQVTKGVDLVGKAGAALSGITDRVSHISDLMSGMASGATEQSTGLGEINLGVSQLDQVTQQNASLVQDATMACEVLSREAQHLIDLVDRFRTQAPADNPVAVGREARMARRA